MLGGSGRRSRRGPPGSPLAPRVVREAWAPRALTRTPGARGYARRRWRGPSSRRRGEQEGRSEEGGSQAKVAPKKGSRSRSHRRRGRGHGRTEEGGAVTVAPKRGARSRSHRRRGRGHGRTEEGGAVTVAPKKGAGHSSAIGPHVRSSHDPRACHADHAWRLSAARPQLRASSSRFCRFGVEKAFRLGQSRALRCLQWGRSGTSGRSTSCRRCPWSGR